MELSLPNHYKFSLQNEGYHFITQYGVDYAVLFQNESAVDYLIKEHTYFISPEYLDTNEKTTYFPESYFVSSNKGDFSSKLDKERIHEDLEPLLNSTNIKFYFTLARLIKSLEEEFLTQEEEFAIEHADESLFCFICNNEYFSSVFLSEGFLVPDENKGLNLVNQYRINFSATDNKVYKSEDFMSPIRTAQCSYCGSQFIECTCGELNYVEFYNEPISCHGQCGNAFIINADIDRKGSVLSKEYEIIIEKICKACGNSVDKLNTDELCSKCEIDYSFDN